MSVTVVAFFLVLSILGIALRIIRRKNVDLVLKSAMTRNRERYDGTIHIFFCLTDHFEPFWNGADRLVAVRRVEKWVTTYPKVADGFRDNSGRPPQHSFFYPAEEYDRQCVSMLADLQQKGYGSVEIHLHHDRDTSEGFREKIVRFRDTLNKEHGLLHVDARTGGIEYAFIHGMFALDDSRPDGRWCGVRDEISILKETGCYADFTFPSAPDPTQPPVLNKIYYATDDPMRPKSHHTGVEAQFGRPASGDLLMVTGPLSIDWRRCKNGFLPGIENGAISGHYPQISRRVDNWVRVGIAIRDWPSWIFVKVHTHGAQESVMAFLFNDGMKSLYSHLLAQYNDGRRYVLHFVRPREVYYCVRALESANAAWITNIESFEYAPLSDDHL
jgi:hypothetical protein